MTNHVHLVLFDAKGGEVIERSMQLIQGQVAQQYNRRKHRLGGFWQDRYHPTAMQSGIHLRRCMTYVDLNMARAGVVTHPAQWRQCGFNEIRQPRSRYRIFDLEQAAELLGFPNIHQLAAWQAASVADRLLLPQHREPIWTESAAVGEIPWLEQVARSLCLPQRFHPITEHGDLNALEEPPPCLQAQNAPEMTF